MLVASSYGVGTPLVAAAWGGPITWGVAVGSAGYMGLREGANLFDRSIHGQTVSMRDPDARAAWLSVVGAGLTVLGVGAMRATTRLASGTSKFAPTLARATGGLNASANLVDASASINQTHTLSTMWTKLTPAQRAQMALSIAFWGGMVGVSTKASGGRLTDAFSFRAQMNSAMLESGAAIRQNANMVDGQVLVKTGYNKEGRLNVSIEHGPGASQASLDIHRTVARKLIDNSGAQGLIRRTLGEGAQFRPGSRSEEVALEVVKYRALLQAHEERIARAPMEQRSEFVITRDAYAKAFREYNTELKSLVADPVADARIRGYVAARELSDIYITTPQLIETIIDSGYHLSRGRPETLVQAMTDVSRQLGKPIVHEWRKSSGASQKIVHRISTNVNEVKMHSDGFADEHPPSFLIIGCERPSTKGGKNLLADGVAIQAALTPQEINTLKRGVQFKKTKSEARVGVFSEIAGSHSEMVRFRMRAEVSEAAQPTWNKLLRVIKENTIEMKMQPGDILFIDNHRMLHGRTAIEQGERLMHRAWVDAAGTNLNLGIDPKKVEARRKTLREHVQLLHQAQDTAVDIESN
ncbi:MAG: TauD/TfdA family dioxygenase [Myxococcota bacterium]